MYSSFASVSFSQKKNCFHSKPTNMLTHAQVTVFNGWSMTNSADAGSELSYGRCRPSSLQKMRKWSSSTQGIPRLLPYRFNKKKKLLPFKTNQKCQADREVSHAHARTNTCTQTHALTHAHIHKCTHTLTHTHTLPLTHTYSNTYVTHLWPVVQFVQ
jgi:hypothetical protein